MCLCVCCVCVCVLCVCVLCVEPVFVCARARAHMCEWEGGVRVLVRVQVWAVCAQPLCRLIHLCVCLRVRVLVRACACPFAGARA